MNNVYDHPTKGRTVDSSDGGGDDGGMEARLARLESDMGHVKGSLVDVRHDVRATNSKVDALADRIDDKIDRLGDRMDGKIWLILGAFGAGFALLMGAILGIYSKL